MLLITSSPRRFVSCLALLRVLFLLCACGNPDVYPPTSASRNVSAQTLASATSLVASASQTVLASGIFMQSGASSHRINGELTLIDSVMREDAAMNSGPGVSQATLIEAAYTPVNGAIFPTRATLAVNQTLQFRVGVKTNAHHALKWLVEGHEGGDASVGTVSPTGRYTAPRRPTPWPSVTITAVNAYQSEVFGSAVVTVEPARRVASFRASH